MSALPIITFLEDAKLKTKFCASMSAVGESDLISPLSCCFARGQELRLGQRAK